MKAPQTSRNLNQEKYHIARGTAELSLTIKNLKDVRLVDPITVPQFVPHKGPWVCHIGDVLAGWSWMVL